MELAGRAWCSLCLGGSITLRLLAELAVLGAEVVAPPAQHGEAVNGGCLAESIGAGEGFLLVERELPKLGLQLSRAWRCVDHRSRLAQFIQHVHAAHLNQLPEDRERSLPRV